MKKPLVIILAILGLFFIGLAIYYWTTPAGSLPSFLPGHLAGSTHKHLKHGLAALILGVGCFIWAWFASGKKSSKSPISAENNSTE